MIVRDLEAASRREFDVVVIGGGIYGVSLLREAARRGLSACLCEAADFGGATSWNSLRIVHGGLRYLQTLDFRRFLQSVDARRQMARLFPTLVRPLSCLMPLYGQGMKRASVMRMALMLNDVLSSRRNCGVADAVRLPAGKVLDAAATREAFPQVRAAGIEGGACWSDYYMASSERILIELLRDACRSGAMALNYVPVASVDVDQGRVRGVRVKDGLTNSSFAIAGRRVVNCAGPGLRQFALDQRSEALFRPSLAFNLLIDVEIEGEGALAVAPPRPGAPVLFLVRQAGFLLAGTWHVPRAPGTIEAVPNESEIADFLGLLNDAIPGLGVRRERVCRVFAGLLPVESPASVQLRTREAVIDHGRSGGPIGLFTVSGVKYTTAGDVARALLDRLGFAAPAVDNQPLPLAPATPLLTDGGRGLAAGGDEVTGTLLRVAEEECAHSVEDIVLRRTNWAISTRPVDVLLAEVAACLGPGWPIRPRSAL